MSLKTISKTSSHNPVDHSPVMVCYWHGADKICNGLWNISICLIKKSLKNIDSLWLMFWQRQECLEQIKYNIQIMHSLGGHSSSKFFLTTLEQFLVSCWKWFNKVWKQNTAATLIFILRFWTQHKIRIKIHQAFNKVNLSVAKLIKNTNFRNTIWFLF